MARYDDDRALRSTERLLAEAKAYPWKTTRYLSRRLKEKYDLTVDASTLEEALVREAAKPEHLIRYSIYPARKSLDLLWAHVSNVGEFAELPDIFLHDDPRVTGIVGEVGVKELPMDAPWCFLSHSFRDLRTVIHLRDELVSRGYGVWVAEVEIGVGDTITKAVQAGLRQSDELVAFVSPRSLRSRWVLKEIGVAVNEMRLPPVVVVDGTSPDLIELFAAWVANEDNWPDQVAMALDGVIDSHDEQAATELPALIIGGLGEVPPDKRRVVTYPEVSPLPGPGFMTIDGAFGLPEDSSN